MKIKLAAGDRTVEEFNQSGKLSTEKILMNFDSKEYIQRRKQLEILDLFVTIDYDPDLRLQEDAQFLIDLARNVCNASPQFIGCKHSVPKPSFDGIQKAMQGEPK